MNPTRRELFAAGAGAVLAGVARAADPLPRTRLGVVIHSHGIRLAHRPGPDAPDFADPIDYLDHCAALGAGGVQTRIGVRDPAYLTRLRAKAEAHGMFIEASVAPPKDAADVGRFDAELRCAAAAGATVVRTVCLGTRRYETFISAEAFRAFARKAEESLRLAEPVAVRHGVRLGVENHKDWRVDELVGLMKRLDSRYVGICLDTGNSIALLEDPMAVVRAYAPWTVTTHLKDMAVAECPDGFLLAEVPLGRGFLDLKEVVRVVEQARPGVRWNLEMITRDPLEVPCLTPGYWATLDAVPGKQLAAMLALVRAKAAPQTLPAVGKLPLPDRIRAEDENVRASLKAGREALGL